MAETVPPVKTILPFPKPAAAGKVTSSTEKIWGKAVYGHGYAGVPSLLIQGQRRLGISPTQMNIILQLLEYWHEPSRKPFPTKKELAKRIGIADKTIQINIRALETAGLIKREQRKTASGDWNSNVYHLDGLIARVQAMEPEFAAEKAARKAARAALSTPTGLRKRSGTP